jgi:hypothetical protein
VGCRRSISVSRSESAMVSRGPKMASRSLMAVSLCPLRKAILKGRE